MSVACFPSLSVEFQACLSNSEQVFYSQRGKSKERLGKQATDIIFPSGAKGMR
jgi:hypothetical protein